MPFDEMELKERVSYVITTQPRITEALTPNLSENIPPTGVIAPWMTFFAAVTKMKSPYPTSFLLKYNEVFTNLMWFYYPLLLIQDMIYVFRLGKLKSSEKGSINRNPPTQQRHPEGFSEINFFVSLKNFFMPIENTRKKLNMFDNFYFLEI